MDDGALERALPAARTSHRDLLAEVALLGDAEMGQPSLLPGWSVGHVLSHLARNADGQRATLEAALRGQIVAQYRGGQAGRAAEIAAGSRRSATEVLADLRAAVSALETTWARFDGDLWNATVRPRETERPAWACVFARWREVEVHRVDLNLGYRPSQWPPTLVELLLAELTGLPDRLARRLPAGVAVELFAEDTGWRYTGCEPEPVVLSGPAWALAAWLSGRTESAVPALRGKPPRLAPWA